VAAARIFCRAAAVDRPILQAGTGCTAAPCHLISCSAPTSKAEALYSLCSYKTAAYALLMPVLAAMPGPAVPVELHVASGFV